MKSVKKLIHMLFGLMVGIPVVATLAWLVVFFAAVAYVGKSSSVLVCAAFEWLFTCGKADKMDFLKEFTK